MRNQQQSDLYIINGWTEAASNEQSQHLSVSGILKINFQSGVFGLIYHNS